MTTNLRIVIADDDPQFLNELKEFVEDLGHQVIGMAGTGREVVEHCRLCAPDLVITDATMPGMNGVEACQIIRQQMELPVIVLAESDDKGTGEEAGIGCRRLFKPFPWRDLKLAIRDVLAETRGDRCIDYLGTPASHWFG